MGAARDERAQGGVLEHLPQALAHALDRALDRAHGLHFAAAALEHDGGLARGERRGALERADDVAERHLLGRAREGLEEGAPAVEQDDGDLIRADRDLRLAALELVALRDEICRRGLLTADACVIAGVPSWVFDPPEAAPTAEVIYRRTRELSDAMGPFLEVGCGLGQAPEDGPEFCSVE